MLTRRILLAAAMGVMLGAIPASAAAQTTEPAVNGAFETLYTRLRFDGDGGAVTAPGVTARIMWNPAVSTGEAPSLLARTSLGLYGTYTPKRDLQAATRFSVFEIGGVAQMRPFASPLAGRVEPFLALGAGLLQTDITVPLPRGAATSPLFESSGAALTLTPGAGAAVRLTPSLALQGELRDVVTFRGDTRHNLALGAGLRLGF